MATAAEEITDACRQAFDAKREVFLPDDITLKLLSYEQGAGEVELIEITDGWMVKQSKDRSTSMVTVQIVDGDNELDSIMRPPPDTVGVSRFSMDGKTYRVESGGIIPPLAAPRIWEITGEEIRVQ